MTRQIAASTVKWFGVPSAVAVTVFVAWRLRLSGAPMQPALGEALAALAVVAVNGHWEIRLGGLVMSGLVAASFPGWWPPVLPAGGG